MRLFSSQYINQAGTRRILIEADNDASHPRKDCYFTGHLVASHRRYNFEDDGARTDLESLLASLFPDYENDVMECPHCGGDPDAYVYAEDDGDSYTAPEDADWMTCTACRGSGTLTTQIAPGDAESPALYIGKLPDYVRPDGTTMPQWSMRCERCLPYAKAGHPGDEPICPQCQGDGHVDNPNYVATDSMLGLYEGIQKVDPHEEHVFWLPVYMYEHSGIVFSHRPFSCGWDSGQLGFIWMSRQEAEAELPHDGTLETLRAAAHRALKAEIETFSQFVSGEVYAYTCERLELPHGMTASDASDGEGEWIMEESCGGFYGMDLNTNAMPEHWTDDYMAVFLEAEGLTAEQFEAECRAERAKHQEEAA